MLRITIPRSEGWDPVKEEFVDVEPAVTLDLEHSLVALSKWESKWNKPFFAQKPKTDEEVLDYIVCMTVTENVDPKVYYRLSKENVTKINDYINAPMTATTFSEDQQGKKNREQITSELIYYWMTALNIPWEAQNWHINRLLTLVRVCNVKNAPPKKMSRNELIARQRAINEANKKRFNTKG